MGSRLRIAHDAGALKKNALARVTVNTTVQPKNVTFPTDAKLLETVIHQLGKLARQQGVPLRQSYGRVAKRAAMMAGRYAFAKQFKRMNRRIKLLRTRRGRLIRDIRRKIDGDEGLEQAFAIEAIIGHCMTDGHLSRNFLKGRSGDQFNAVMSAVGYNLRLILKWLRKLLRLIFAAIYPQPALPVRRVAY